MCITTFLRLRKIFQLENISGANFEKTATSNKILQTDLDSAALISLQNTIFLVKRDFDSK